MVCGDHVNSKPLYFEDKSPSGLHLCTACDMSYRNERLAIRCCTCSKCGKPTGLRARSFCDSCTLENIKEREADRFEKAEKIQEDGWNSFVYLEDTGNDGYSSSIEAFRDSWDYDHDPEDDFPSYVWACKPVQFVKAEIDSILDRICENAYEDFDPNYDLNGIKELEDALEKFVKVNEKVCAYEPDYTKAILLKPK